MTSQRINPEYHFSARSDALVHAGGCVHVSLYPRETAAEELRANIESYELEYILLHPGIGFFGTFGSVHSPLNLLKAYGANNIPAAGCACAAYGYFNFSNLVFNWSAQLPMFRAYSGCMYGKMTYNIRRNFSEVCRLSEDPGRDALARVQALSEQGARFKLRVTIDGVVFICPVHTLEVRADKIWVDTRYQSIPFIALRPSELTAWEQNLSSQIEQRSQTMPLEKAVMVNLTSATNHFLLYFISDGTSFYHHDFRTGQERQVTTSDVTLLADHQASSELGSISSLRPA